MAAPNNSSIWTRSHYLDRMTLRELVIAYFQHHAIIAYLALTGLSVGLYCWRPAAPLPTIATIALILLAYPLIWYVLHRWVLHCHWMFKVPALAGTWKRIHYDHHRDPHHLEVLFGALYTTLPTLLLVSAVPGYAIGGFGGAAAGFATGLLCTCFYEFFHCIQHLTYKPRLKWLATMKVRHMEHHFHDEDGNFGITNFAWDRLFGTLYTRATGQRKARRSSIWATPTKWRRFIHGSPGAQAVLQSTAPTARVAGHHNEPAFSLKRVPLPSPSFGMTANGTASWGGIDASEGEPMPTRVFSI